MFQQAGITVIVFGHNKDKSVSPGSGRRELWKLDILAGPIYWNAQQTDIDQFGFDAVPLPQFAGDEPRDVGAEAAAPWSAKYDRYVKKASIIIHVGLQFVRFSTSRITWPSGSATRQAFANPSSAAAVATIPDDASLNPARWSCIVAAATSPTSSVVCHRARSFDFNFAGLALPSPAARNSRSSMPGPSFPRREVIRSRAPNTLFRCSCSVP